MDEYNCNRCKNYDWYNDKCRKWDCNVDFRAVHNCFELHDAFVRDFMAGKKDGATINSPASPNTL